MATEAKTTIKSEVKEIKTDFVPYIRMRNELAKRDERAKKYSDRCERKRIAKAKRKQKIKENVALFFVYAFLIAVAVVKFGNVTNANSTENTEHYTYSMQGELQGNCVVLSDGNCHEVDETDANYTSEPKKVEVVLDNNGTEDKTDDIILNIFQQ